MTTRSITIRIDGDARGLNVAINAAEGSIDELTDSLGGADRGLKAFASNAAAVFAGGALLDGAKALGGKFMDAFAEAMEQDKLNDKLAAQLGLSAEDSAMFGRIAGDLYTSAYGESISEVNDALRFTKMNLGDMAGSGEADIKKITATALDFASAFDEDVSGATRAVGTMLKSGLARDAEHAFDIITVGMQNGANAGDDLLDTFSEYSTQFREVGVSGEMAMGLMSQAMKGGARDADTVADAIKEFAIRSKDGSATSVAGFQAIGLNAQDMFQTFARGGPEADAAMADVIQRLKAMEDPVAQDAAAVALFGTKAEDLQDALYAMDPTTAVASLGQVEGAAQRMGDTLNDNAATKLTAFKRQLQQGLVNFIRDGVLPQVVNFGERLVPIFEEGRGAITAFANAFKAGDGDVTSSGLAGHMEVVGFHARQLWDAFQGLTDEWMPKLQTAFRELSDALTPFWETIRGNENLLITAGVLLGGVLVVAVYALVSAFASLAVAVLAATWPFILIAAYVFAWITAVRYAYENFEWFRQGVDTVVAWLRENVPPIWEQIRMAIATAFDWVINVGWPALQGALTSFMGFMNETLLPAVQLVWQAIVNAINLAVAIIGPIISFIVDFIASNWGRVSAITTAIWDNIRNVIANAWQIISNLVQLALNLFTGNWGAAWDNVKNILSAAWDTLTTLVRNGISVVQNLFMMLMNWIGSVAGRIFEPIVGGFRSAINGVINKWNSLSFTIPKVEFMGFSAGGQTLSPPRIPAFHSGGIFRAERSHPAGLAMLLDGERVVPRAMAGRPGMTGSGTTVINVNVPNGFVGDEEALSRALRRVILAGQNAGVRMPWEPAR